MTLRYWVTKMSGALNKVHKSATEGRAMGSNDRLEYSESPSDSSRADSTYDPVALYQEGISSGYFGPKVGG